MPSQDFFKLFKKNRIAVLVPTYNNEQTLAHVLISVLEYSQDVIVVNDGSTDSTTEILHQFPQVNLLKIGRAHV